MGIKTILHRTLALLALPIEYKFNKFRKAITRLGPARILSLKPNNLRLLFISKHSKDLSHPSLSLPKTKTRYGQGPRIWSGKWEGTDAVFL
ncbi:pentatricopeptide repeat-containing protein [Corchorus olitorius]|uniref:Pentatricopeptide repeat-containing protein n=1 Tax=Corchorus olitorius TaxID=93759 RepID=A0A1R3HHQ6_9ROSI|nr:pentatricopeptide repeat-containing protein [Corchorus olitorius]